MWFTSLVLKNLWRRKVRSTLTCASLAIAVCAVVAMLGTAEGYVESLGGLYENQGADMVVTRADLAQRINSRLHENLASELVKIRGVKSVEPVLVDIVNYTDVNLLGVYIFGLDSDSLAMRQLKIKEGRKFGPNDTRHAVLGSGLARNLGKKLGDQVEIEGGMFEIIGIAESYNMLENNGAVVPLRELQILMQSTHQVTTFLIVLEDTEDKASTVKRVGGEIEKLTEFRGTPMKLSAQSARDHVKTTFELQVLSALAWASSTLTLFIGLVSMLNTMMMSVSERVRELATLRAIGWRRSRVVRMILMEALLLATIGATLGALIAWPIMGVLANYHLTGAVVITHITLEILAKGVGLGILAGMLGAFYPAFIATQLSPALALRHE